MSLEQYGALHTVNLAKLQWHFLVFMSVQTKSCPYVLSCELYFQRHEKFEMFKNPVLYLFVSNALLWITYIEAVCEFILYKRNTFIILFGTA